MNNAFLKAGRKVETLDPDRPATMPSRDIMGTPVGIQQQSGNGDKRKKQQQQEQQGTQDCAIKRRQQQQQQPQL